MTHGAGHMAILGGHTVIDYYMLKFNASLSSYPYREAPSPEELLTMDKKGYDIIATTFRMYTKDTFLEYKPSLTNCMQDLRSRLEANSLYHKVYQAGEWHEVYFKVD